MISKTVVLVALALFCQARAQFTASLGGNGGYGSMLDAAAGMGAEYAAGLGMGGRPQGQYEVGVGGRPGPFGAALNVASQVSRIPGAYVSTVFDTASKIAADVSEFPTNTMNMVLTGSRPGGRPANGGQGGFGAMFGTGGRPGLAMGLNGRPGASAGMGLGGQGGYGAQGGYGGSYGLGGRPAGAVGMGLGGQGGYGAQGGYGSSYGLGGHPAGATGMGLVTRPGAGASGSLEVAGGPATGTSGGVTASGRPGLSGIYGEMGLNGGAQAETQPAVAAQAAVDVPKPAASATLEI